MGQLFIGGGESPANPVLCAWCAQELWNEDQMPSGDGDWRGEADARGRGEAHGGRDIRGAVRRDGERGQRQR